tara:strand:- start:311 stop:529 length:219 start_codon:yes stop_codon:yes gene_type:complete
MLLSKYRLHRIVTLSRGHYPLHIPEHDRLFGKIDRELTKLIRLKLFEFFTKLPSPFLNSLPKDEVLVKDATT